MVVFVFAVFYVNKKCENLRPDMENKDFFPWTEWETPGKNVQSNLVISNSLISNYRLSRSENLVSVLT